MSVYGSSDVLVHMHEAHAHIGHVLSLIESMHIHSIVMVLLLLSFLSGYPQAYFNEQTDTRLKNADKRMYVYNVYCTMEYIRILNDDDDEA